MLPRFDPARANYASFAGPYVLMLVALTAMFAVIHALIIATALGVEVDMARWIPLLIAVLLIVLGNTLGKVRPNYFVGVRTPWTLASARSWEKTHRAGGRVFVVESIALAITALVGQRWLFIAVFAGGGVSLVWLVYYSYVEWRNDTDRVPATGTRSAAGER